MKTVIAVLFGLYFGLLSYPAWSIVLTPTDGDIDSIVIEGGLNDGQLLALTLPDTSPGVFWSLNLTNLFDADQRLAVDFVTSPLETEQFSVYLWDTVNWHAPTNITNVGSDAVILEWIFDHGVDVHQSVKLLAVDVQAVPIPPAVWLFGSGLLGMIGVARHGNYLKG